MGKIGFMTLLKREDSKLSPHFGKAKWLAVVDLEKDTCEFFQNTGLNGKTVAEMLVKHGCEDVVFTAIGEGALQHLKDAHIYGWSAPADIPLTELRRMYMRGELRHARKASSGGQGLHIHGKAGQGA